MKSIWNAICIVFWLWVALFAFAHKPEYNGMVLATTLGCSIGVALCWFTEWINE